MTSIRSVSADVPLVPLALGLLAGFGTAHGIAPGHVWAPLFAAALLPLAGVWRPARPFALAAGLGLLAAWHGMAFGIRPAGSVPWADSGFHVLEGSVRASSPAPRRTWTIVTTHIGEGRDRVALRARLQIRIPRRATRDPAPGVRMRLACFVRTGGRGTLFLVPESVEILAPAGPWSAATHALRTRAVARFDALLDGNDAGLARAMIAGDRSRLSWRDRQRFRDTGQAHLLAVSGLHVGLLLGCIALCLRRAGLGMRATWVASLFVVAIYVPFAGAPRSAVRAGIGAAVYLLARLAGRTPTGGGVLAAVVVVVFMSGTGALTELGLQLSLAAVAGILILAPPLTRAFVPEQPNLPGPTRPRRAWLRRSLAVALGAWLGTAPLVMHAFAKVCLIGAPLSIAALPLAAALVGLGFGLLVFGGVPALAAPLVGAFAWVAETLRGLFDLVLASGLGAATAHSPSPVFLVAYAMLVAAVAVGSARTGRRALAALAALFGAVVLSGGRHGYDPRALMPGAEGPSIVSGWPLLAVALGLIGLAVSAVRLRWLTVAGSAGAAVLGFLTAWQIGLAGFAALIATFLGTTLASKLPGRHRSGARSLRQVIANGAAPLAGALLCLAGASTVGTLVFYGGLAFLGADTIAAELGVRYGGRPRRLFHPGEPLAPGQSGGVTPVGLAASAAGACLPLVALLLTPDAAPVIVGVVAGVLGGIVDSALGDTVQYRGVSPETGSITELRSVNGVPTKPLSGYAWLDNDAVNLVSGLAAGALAALIGQTGLF